MKRPKTCPLTQEHIYELDDVMEPREEVAVKSKYFVHCVSGWAVLLFAVSMLALLLAVLAIVFARLDSNLEIQTELEALQLKLNLTSGEC